MCGSFLIYPAETPIIEKVESKSPAAAAGLRPGDIIRGFNQTPIYNPIALLEYISKHPNEELVLHVERNGSKLDIPVKPTLLPTAGEMKPRIEINGTRAGLCRSSIRIQSSKFTTVSPAP